MVIGSAMFPLSFMLGGFMFGLTGLGLAGRGKVRWFHVAPAIAVGVAMALAPAGLLGWWLSPEVQTLDQAVGFAVGCAVMGFGVWMLIWLYFGVVGNIGR